jgi:hypothetical protein
MNAIFIWKGKHCAGGNLEATIRECKRIGIDTVWLKVLDGVDFSYASYPGQMYDATLAFKDAGLAVWGWQYIYGDVPGSEALKAIDVVRALELDGFIIDAEKEFKSNDQERRAKAYMTVIRDIGVPVGLSSYRYPSLHRELPWDTFLEGCDYHAPQVYWGPNGVVANLERSVRELKALADLPVIPVGRAYIGDGNDGKGLVHELEDFFHWVGDNPVEGISFWSLDHTYLHNPGGEWREAIRTGLQTIPQHTPIPPVIEPRPLKMRVGVPALNIREGPGVQHRDIGDLVGNEEITVMNISGRDAWVYFELPDGRRGWACARQGGSQYLVKLEESHG